MKPYNGFPVLDAKLEIGIGAHESPAKVAMIRLGDVTVAAASPDVTSDITTDNARIEFLDQTEVAEDPLPDDIVIAEEFVGYMLDPRNTTGSIYPRFHASYETVTGEVVSLGKGASLSLTTIPFLQVFERQLHFPWDGASPSPSPRVNGHPEPDPRSRRGLQGEQRVRSRTRLRACIDWRSWDHRCVQRMRCR